MNMLKSLLLGIIISLAVHCNASAQTYCLMEFFYKGAFLSDSLHHYKLGFPTTYSLMDHAGIDSLEFDYVESKTRKFKVLSGGAGCNFCNDDYVMNGIIKKERAYFPVEVFVQETTEPKIILVPFSQIHFSQTTYKGRETPVIDLGTIKY